MDKQSQLYEASPAIAESCVPALCKATRRNDLVCVSHASRSENKNLGFSLVELAAALMVIGLLLSGVLKAQGFMDCNKTHLLADDFRNVTLYLNEYLGKFSALPGDDPTIGTVHSHLDTATPCSISMVGKCIRGNGVIDGKWNDITPASESFLFWQQVRLAGFSSGDPDIASANYRPKNIVGGNLGITNQTSTPIAGLKGGYIVCSDGIAGKYVKQLDLAMDDGNTTSGFMRTTISGVSINGTAVATDAIVENDLYLVCMGV